MLDTDQLVFEQKLLEEMEFGLQGFQALNDTVPLTGGRAQMWPKSNRSISTLETQLNRKHYFKKWYEFRCIIDQSVNFCTSTNTQKTIHKKFDER